MDSVNFKHLYVNVLRNIGKMIMYRNHNDNMDSVEKYIKDNFEAKFRLDTYDNIYIVGSSGRNYRVILISPDGKNPLGSISSIVSINAYFRDHEKHKITNVVFIVAKLSKKLLELFHTFNKQNKSQGLRVDYFDYDNMNIDKSNHISIGRNRLLPAAEAELISSRYVSMPLIQETDAMALYVGASVDDIIEINNIEMPLPDLKYRKVIGRTWTSRASIHAAKQQGE
jgi:hypothetical protein